MRDEHDGAGELPIVHIRLERIGDAVQPSDERPRIHVVRRPRLADEERGHENDRQGGRCDSNSGGNPGKPSKHASHGLSDFHFFDRTVPG